MNDKNISHVVLGIVSVIAVVGLILLFISTSTANGVYGGAIKNVAMPYYEDRVVLVNTGNDMEIQDISTVQNIRNPQTSALDHREPTSAYGLLDNCEGLIIQGKVPAGFTYEAGWNDVVNRYKVDNCVDTSALIGQYCCKK